jgi:hypothetical protein
MKGNNIYKEYKYIARASTCFQALLVFGETNPLTQSPLPVLITPISEQLEGVTGDRAAATVKADGRL